MRSVGEEDAGKYYCQVEERRLQEDSWKMKASDTSGYLQLKVLAPEDRLTLNRTELTLIAAEGSNLTLPCNVVSTSVFDATFAITWWKVQTPGHQLLFNASRLGQFVYPSEEGNRLQYERTSELMFQLRILPTRLSDTGIYYCRIQEWLRTPRGVWYQLGQQSGGNMSVTIQAAGFHSHICLVPGLFYFLLVVLVFLLFLLVVLGWWLLTRWRNKPRSSSPRNENDFWLSVKTFDMKVEKKENAETDEAEQIKLCSKRDLSH
ncbi:hypothetical protein GDO78_017580 [Eleutherodactylus coqui]|uniref:Ig-like domain-containing protein n=1 Tax=Eleutherodactylus coqui TaxID=57060 RepID=A0A8J6K098_ELECQ|nr:hypothetical protein GDO78_017580 [Eleutherodactylus coqui]